MKKSILLLLAVFVFNTTKAQLTITDSLSNLQITNLLQGLGVTISNLIVNCPAQGMGEFSGTSEMAITQGLVLSTGLVDLIASPNNTSNASHSYSNPGDAQLNSLASPTVTYDACILEFDCLPIGDTLLFNFSFGSEEYMEYVSTTPGGINDVFGIFVSGPGINDTINAAALPNGTAVSIFNVNANSNSTYYYDNGDGNGSGTAPDGAYIQYDGFTTNLTAFAVVIPNSTYHFKIGIADGGDGIFDSGVFLEAFSFKSLLGTSTEIKDITNSNNLILFPNPTSKTVQINYELKVLSDVFINIYDITGKLVRSQKEADQVMGKQNQTIYLENLIAGFYTVSLQTNSGIITSKLIVK